MAPVPQTIIEDEEEFLDDVAAFHEKRGTTFDREGKVSGRPISLHKLYKLVMERGGYDVLSAERMQWRSLVKEFGFGKTHEGVITFQLKTAYYKNLAAYEIAKYWGEEPPPKEILEDLSARGGNLRTRTLENYRVPEAASRPNDSTVVDGGESVDEEQTTPKREKTEAEEPGSGSRYPTRMSSVFRNASLPVIGVVAPLWHKPTFSHHLSSPLTRYIKGQLRQDPKRTQMYQPDLQPTRSRNVRATDSPATPAAPQQSYANASNDPRNPGYDWHDKYEPRTNIALTLRQVQTPGNDPLYYPRKLQAKLQATPRPPPEPQQYLKQSVPGGMTGPNIYLRCLYGLRSGIREEQDFALHHLVKVSFERGDKYKFEGFPFLAESLMEKALEITELVYGVKWEITYDEDVDGSPVNTLNAAVGTPNLLERIQTTTSRVHSRDLETAESSERLEKLKEAALVLRNMVLLEENAIFLSRFPLFKDLLTIAICLPDEPALDEFKQSALEIIEQVTRYWTMNPEDPLYLSLLPYLESGDRGMLISALRSINRIGLETPETHRLIDVPLTYIERLFSFTLLDSDIELLENTLDFLYEYTAIPENNTELLSKDFHLLPNMIGRLTNLLLHQSSSGEETTIAGRSPKMPALPPSVPTIPYEIHQQLIKCGEPERSSRWLRCCFEESPNGDITQITIWQAYQQRFANHSPVAAADFIKNVSQTFGSAQAQVIQGIQPRFIIKGIKPRRVLLDLQGRPLFKCLWEVAPSDTLDPHGRTSQRHLCSSWHVNRERLLSHIMTEHLKFERKADGHFSSQNSDNWACRWTLCSRHSPFSKSNELVSHVRMHIPENAEAMSKIIHELAYDVKEPDPVQTKHTYHITPTDFTTHPCGVAWMSVMIMRNLARYANKHGSAFEKDGIPLNDKLFGGHKYVIFHMLSANRTLRDLITDLLQLIDKGDRDEKRGVKREHESEDGTGYPG
ncbi:uncharacterized protein Z518_07282 [Rhinocladiella mackenziei CBS 650.93]|uniref:Rhinocladiella mackenziei CBS 650.93 unplaced genomic scaffold supercont1.5, whole genome shotgun sequence n=1 Tax=Rhinocladiella mackenziei CBS 650.93 TaxID=1442369 RepID=A0A0D2ID04_9EURO|nr:uncharacterized protein Z518_07282 [Rhinocladiella mackenziei CBS 650.93]KIX03729.1 hypothetical protein Z518_07282 [Rhinocladiella mackenziei CBS 650.93]